MKAQWLSKISCGRDTPGPLNVIWDNAPAPLRQGQEWRGHAGVPAPVLSLPKGTLGLELRLVNLPGYSPDFNASEAVWG